MKSIYGYDIVWGNAEYSVLNKEMLCYVIFSKQSTIYTLFSKLSSLDKHVMSE